jgi:ribulose-phosphate 3-epimerase
MDGNFTPTKSPEINEIWLPDGIVSDIHLMYENPEDFYDEIITLKPNIVIVHAESKCDVPRFASRLRENNIKVGLAVLQETDIDEVAYIFPHVQHVLIFSGDLGKFGGHADLGLIEKVKKTKETHKFLEIGWDGGTSLENIKQLADGGVDVLNVGGAIQRSPNPQNTFDELTNIISQ